MRKKYAERIDGVDLSRYRVGDTLNLPSREARLLLAEEWAAPERRARPRATQQGGNDDDDNIQNRAYEDVFRSG